MRSAHWILGGSEFSLFPSPSLGGFGIIVYGLLCIVEDRLRCLIANLILGLGVTSDVRYGSLAALRPDITRMSGFGGKRTLKHAENEDFDFR